jgi:hypothetical protein
MTYEQYITNAMKTLYGDPTDVEEVTSRIQHLEGKDEGERPHNFYMAHLELMGKIVHGEDSNYSSVSAYGHRIQKVIDFMREQGFEMSTIDHWNRVGEPPVLDFSFTMNGEIRTA